MEYTVARRCLRVLDQMSTAEYRITNQFLGGGKEKKNKTKENNMTDKVYSFLRSQIFS